MSGQDKVDFKRPLKSVNGNLKKEFQSPEKPVAKKSAPKPISQKEIDNELTNMSEKPVNINPISLSSTKKKSSNKELLARLTSKTPGKSHRELKFAVGAKFNPHCATGIPWIKPNPTTKVVPFSFDRKNVNSDIKNELKNMPDKSANVNPISLSSTKKKPANSELLSRLTSKTPSARKGLNFASGAKFNPHCATGIPWIRPKKTTKVVPFKFSSDRKPKKESNQDQPEDTDSSGEHSDSGDSATLSGKHPK